MRKQIAVLAAVAVAAGACGDSTAGIGPDPAALFHSGVSDGGVVPTAGDGTNIPGEGPAVCEALAPGSLYLGFKVDNPSANDGGTTDGVTWWTNATNQYLGWSAAGATVRLVLVKGGPNHNVYGYNPPAFSSDDGLHAPNVPGGVPEISHFTFCYQQDDDPAQGCTPGFWKNRGLSIGEWALAGYNPSANVTTVFNNVRPAQAGASLHQALSFGGGPGLDGGQKILLRAAVAALLNAAHPDVSYPVSAASVISQVNTALGGTRAAMLSLAETLDGYNNAGCPLGAAR